MTALFSDLSGYTALSEKLDPEDVKEITAEVFGAVSGIIAQYDGFIEKFIGDAVMALFGVPRAHEDDPIRAIKAAMKIHAAVKGMNARIESKTGASLSMHTGINTGLVVTGEVDFARGTHGVAGDTINVAARLSGVAGADEIVVGPETHHHAEGYFAFGTLEPVRVKGRENPVDIYKVLPPGDQDGSHRRSGLRADLIGRQVELAELREAVEGLRKGRGAVVCISGETGIGKTRLVEELKESLNPSEIRWFDAQAYSYAQNHPYFPLIDFLNREFSVKEGDTPEKIREKIRSGVKSLTGVGQDFAGYLEGLYSPSAPAAAELSPELWKSRLHEAVSALLSALAQGAPTVICLDDLHWADPSFMELLRFVLSETQHPILFICIYRSGVSLLKSHQLAGLKLHYHEIQLSDLSLSEAQLMLESILGAEKVPGDLWVYFRENVGGNPFYLEEVTNALIQGNVLTRDNGEWRLSRPISQINLPSTIHGLISARLDHLDAESKRILQEASVIGRTFLYDILKKLTALQEKYDLCLRDLERMELIKARTLQPELEYMFIHALTQEVVYDSLLKKEREDLHARIAEITEMLYGDRLSEFYETLAFHYRRSSSKLKAVAYLLKAGRKSLSKYSVEEAHRYFGEGYQILEEKEEKSPEEKNAVLELLADWGYTFYYLGEVNAWVDLFMKNRSLAESLGETPLLGMYYAWMGIGCWLQGRANVAHEFLSMAMRVGEKLSDRKVIGYACTWLTWVCGELGRYEEGMAYGARAQEAAALYPADQYLFFKSLAGIQFCNMFKGDTGAILEGSRRILEYSEKNSNSRAKCFGYWVEAYAHLVSGDMESAIRSSRKSGEAARDPLYALFSKLGLGIAFFSSGRFEESSENLNALLDFCNRHGVRQLSAIGESFLAPQLLQKGQMGEGLKMLEAVREEFLANGRRSFFTQVEILLGAVYSQIATGPKPSLSVMTKNIGFLARNFPSAAKRAEEHLFAAIQIATEMGANWLLAAAYLELGRFYKSRGKMSKAREFLENAQRAFEGCNARSNMKLAQEILSSAE